MRLEFYNSVGNTHPLLGRDQRKDEVGVGEISPLSAFVQRVSREGILKHDKIEGRYDNKMD
jgi:hypothetical protein